MTSQSWLQYRNHLTNLLDQEPYDLIIYLERAIAYTQLGYPDLAAGDAYKALLLTDEVRNEVDEYHEQALESLESHRARRLDILGERPSLKHNPKTSVHRDTNGALDGEAEDEHDGDGHDTSTWALEEEDESGLDMQRLLEQKTVQCYILLAQSLLECGCLRSAMEFCERGLLADDASTRLKELRRLILQAARNKTPAEGSGGQARGADAGLDAAAKEAASNSSVRDLSEQGQARREVYPWNDHEPDRFSRETLRALNEELAKVAPACEVRVTSLPLLSSSVPSNETSPTSSTLSKPAETDNGNDGRDQNSQAAVLQLGLFAKEDIPAGEVFLRETSVLTATTRLHDNLCDACGKVLRTVGTSAGPDSMFASLSLDDEDEDKKVDEVVAQEDNEGENTRPRSQIGNNDSEPVSCPECIDTLFCSEECLSLAQRTYHAALCGGEANLAGIVAKDVPAAQTTDALYTLLLGRALSMAIAQDRHPLDLPELKYIWGDFSPSVPPAEESSGGDGGGGVSNVQGSSGRRFLPFSFEHNIASPLHILQALDVDIYVTRSTLSDTWIFQTIYAKLRGTASAKTSTIPSASIASTTIRGRTPLPAAAAAAGPPPAPARASSSGVPSPMSQGPEFAMPLDCLDRGGDDISGSTGADSTDSEFTPPVRLLPSARETLPDVAAVHPLWCLANHSCDPNVAWEWQDGEMRFWVRRKHELIGASSDSGGNSSIIIDDMNSPTAARTKPVSITTTRAGLDGDDSIHENISMENKPKHEENPDGKSTESEWKEGIRNGQEILSHYCDITLPYRERRDWMMGCLGGACLCRRCLMEEKLERREAINGDVPSG